ncbi:MAG TPA: 50S ribosomal protein L11 methyltransferase [Chitinophagaceae bacterium]|nr:50S ribosomal protein L11 methyltransferase [Chitinophagaceae bacterium]
MDTYLQVNIEIESDLQREIVTAELISIGFDAFEEETKLLKAYVLQNDFDEKAFNSIVDLHQLNYEVESILSKNWNEEWEKNFHPVVIGNFCSVRANFHEPNKNTAFDLVITPKMSFGTGHHATTYLMLELLQEVAFRDAAVLDFGTGTGILAIMAEKLGASKVTAIDLDDWSIRNATENAAMNSCSRIQLVQADNIPADKSFKIILANINKNVIVDDLPVMCKVLEDNGDILLSGLLEPDFAQINAEATKLGLHLQKKGEKSGWIALRYMKLL